MFIIPLSNVVTYTHTATDDLKFRLVQADLWLRSANIHVVTNSANYGDTNAQDATLTTVDVAFFEDFNLADLYFKNTGAGSNTTIRVVGIKMTDTYKAELGVL